MSNTSIRKPGQKYMPVKPDFLEYTGLKSPNTPYEMATRGEVRLVKIGRRTCVDLEHFDACMAEADFIPNRKTG